MFIDTAGKTPEEMGFAFQEQYPTLRFAGHSNPIVKEMRNINNNTKPNPNKLIVLEGIWGVNFVLKYDIKVEYVVVCPEELTTPEAQKLLEALYAKCGRGYLVTSKVFQAIKEKENSAGLVTVCRFPVRSLADIPLKDDMLVAVLDGLEIQGNVGTITRSCDATQVDLIILTNKRVRLTHPKLIKSSMGACLKIPMVAAEMEDAIAWLDANGFKTFLTDTRAEENYFNADYSGRAAIVAGSERYGIARPWYEGQRNLIKIPMLGDCDSLNVGISTTVILYEAALQKKGMLKRVPL
ncbi:MAG: TrmH family RNA methyltransferase [Eubacteriales bacterium]|nr:TrmH family RNA methyltransferase [Eubacteriales bacterium]